MNPFGLVDSLEVGLPLVVLDNFLRLPFFQLYKNRLVLDHLVGGDECAEEPTAGVEDLGDKGIPRQLQLPHKHDNSQDHNSQIDALNKDLLPMFEVLLAKLIAHILNIDQFFPVGFQFMDNLFHALDSGLVFVVVSEHFEYDFKEGEEIFFIFPAFDPVAVPN